MADQDKGDSVKKRGRPPGSSQGSSYPLHSMLPGDTLFIPGLKNFDCTRFSRFAREGCKFTKRTLSAGMLVICITLATHACDTKKILAFVSRGNYKVAYSEIEKAFKDLDEGTLKSHLTLLCSDSILIHEGETYKSYQAAYMKPKCDAYFKHFANFSFVWDTLGMYHIKHSICDQMPEHATLFDSLETRHDG